MFGPPRICSHRRANFFGRSEKVALDGTEPNSKFFIRRCSLISPDIALSKKLQLLGPTLTYRSSQKTAGNRRYSQETQNLKKIRLSNFVGPF